MNEQEMLDLELNFNLLKKELISGEIGDFRHLFLALHIYEQGQFYLSCTDAQRMRLYEILDPSEMAEIFDILEEDNIDSAKFLAEMSDQYAAEMIENMYSDNAADLLNGLEDHNEQANLLQLIEFPKAHDIKVLMNYQDSTAGSIMTREFVAVHGLQTVKEAMYYLKSEAEGAETIYYLYVTDDIGKLQGVLSLKDLILKNDDLLIKEIMNERVISVNVADDQENVAQTFRDYDLLALPVVDDENYLQGIVTVDDIIDVIDTEAASDYSGLAGVDTEELSENPLHAAAKRLPWLIVLLVLGMGTSAINGYYEDIVHKNTGLIMFISTVMGTSGNAGTQALAVAVRRIAMKDESQKSKIKIILAEFVTGILIGLVVGITIFLIVFLWQKQLNLALTASVAMFAAISVGNLAGNLIPLGMTKLGFDPAVASGPFISTLSDLTSVLIYYNIASLIITHI